MRIIFATLAATTLIATTLAAAGPAMAGDHDPRCGNADRSQWMSIADITAKAEATGLKVSKVGRDDGCYEVKGIDAKGQRVEVAVHPVSGEVIKTEIDD